MFILYVFNILTKHNNLVIDVHVKYQNARSQQNYWLDNLQFLRIRHIRLIFARWWVNRMLYSCIHVLCCLHAIFPFWNVSNIPGLKNSTVHNTLPRFYLALHCIYFFFNLNYCLCVLFLTLFERLIITYWLI